MSTFCSPAHSTSLESITYNIAASTLSCAASKVNNGSEKDASTDGQPEISRQGRNTLEYWSIDMAGNEEEHKTLSDLKLDRMPPVFEGWQVKRPNLVLPVPQLKKRRKPEPSSKGKR